VSSARVLSRQPPARASDAKGGLSRDIDELGLHARAVDILGLDRCHYEVG